MRQPRPKLSTTVQDYVEVYARSGWDGRVKRRRTKPTLGGDVESRSDRLAQDGMVEI
jgi:hypothetical protein